MDDYPPTQDRSPDDPLAVALRHTLAIITAAAAVAVLPLVLGTIGLSDALCDNCDDTDTGTYVTAAVLAGAAAIVLAWAALRLAAGRPLVARRTPAAILATLLGGTALLTGWVLIANALGPSGLEARTAVPTAILALLIASPTLAALAHWTAGRAPRTRSPR